MLRGSKGTLGLIGMRHIGVIGSVDRKHGSSGWDEVAGQQAPSWYLDPLVAKQKREAHVALIRKWTEPCDLGAVLKTDLFEEAFGDDQVLSELAPGAKLLAGIDIAQRTVAEAKRKTGCKACIFNPAFVAADVRGLPFKTASFDFVFSNSTLDHFDEQADLQTALNELVRIIRPGGLLLITLDNPSNPLYHMLRLATRGSWAPFQLGCTLSKGALNRSLRNCGLEVLGNDWLIHNPRLLSTAVFKCLRAALGRHADPLIRLLLKSFAFLERLPSRGLTACFVAACARKPHDGNLRENRSPPDRTA